MFSTVRITVIFDYDCVSVDLQSGGELCQCSVGYIVSTVHVQGLCASLRTVQDIRSLGTRLVFVFTSLVSLYDIFI